jgi:hypothetical protein
MSQLLGIVFLAKLTISPDDGKKLVRQPSNSEGGASGVGRNGGDLKSGGASAA